MLATNLEQLHRAQYLWADSSCSDKFTARAHFQVLRDFTPVAVLCTALRTFVWSLSHRVGQRETFVEIRVSVFWWQLTFRFSSCVVGLERDKFDNKTVTFEEHIKEEHNMWHYLFFIVLVKVKDSTEYTGPESYVAEMIKVERLHKRTLHIKQRQPAVGFSIK